MQCAVTWMREALGGRNGESGGEGQAGDDCGVHDLSFMQEALQRCHYNI
jgi:hypothetical protein